MKHLLLALLIFCSCKKESTTPQPTDYTAQNTALLLGKWQLNASTILPAYDIDGNGTKETDRYAALTVCNRTFVFSFTDGSNGVIKTNCTELFKSMYWHLTDYGVTINWHTGINSDAQEIIKNINSTTLETNVLLYPPDGLTYTITNTYNKL